MKFNNEIFLCYKTKYLKKFNYVVIYIIIYKSQNNNSLYQSGSFID